MNANIVHKHRGEYTTTPIQLNTKPYNLRFGSFLEVHRFSLTLLHFPYKKIMQEITQNEKGEISRLNASIIVTINKQAVRLCLEVYYDVRTGEARNKYTVTEKVMRLPISAEKKEILEVVSPYLSRLKEVNCDHDIEILTNWFYRFVQPPTLESIAAQLDDQQKQQAIELLCERFGIQ